MNAIPDILQRILAHKHQEVAAQRITYPLEIIQAKLAESPLLLRGFTANLTACINADRIGVIAEIKRASPSKGLLRADFNPAEIAHSYEQGKAACLSVLTEQQFFQGSDADLISARTACKLPVLRKDFIFDQYQVYQARAMGADAILLIAAVLNDNALHTLTRLAQGLGMDVLLEVHDRAELERALQVEPNIVGINNRNLRTFEVNLNTTIELLHLVPPNIMLVTESGILNRNDVELMHRCGVRGFLVGEAFMRAENPGERLAELFTRN